MPVTVSVHAPLLIRVSGRSLKASTQTLPKLPVSGITRSSSGAGAVPETATITRSRGVVAEDAERGRLRAEARRAESHRQLRWNRRRREPAGRTTRSVASNSGDDDEMTVTRSGHVPLLLRIRSLSTKLRRHALPKLPLSAIAVVSRGVPGSPVADRSTAGAVGSLLRMRMVAVSGATPDGT